MEVAESENPAALGGREESRPLVAGREIVVSRRWLKVAEVKDEEYTEGQGVRDPEAFLRDLKSLGVDADVLTFTQKLPETAPKYRYRFEWENVAAIDTRSYKAWWEGLSQETRRNVRRAEKRGVEVRSVGFGDELVKGIKGIYDSAPVMQGKPNAHYGKSLEAMRAMLSSFEQTREFLGAYLGDELIGFIKLIHMGATTGILHIAAKGEHADKRPANALVAKAVELCEKRGAQYLLYCLFTYGNKAPDSLTEFKRRNGFQGVPCPRYYIPLSWKGRLGLRLGLHRGLLGVLPPKVIELLRGIRAWSHRRKSAATRSAKGESPEDGERATPKGDE